jgi:predicted metal-binding protein
MKKVAVIGCGAFMTSGYGCPGEWRCLKAAAQGEGNFSEPSQVVSFIRCECPGRALVPTVGMTAKMSQIKPDELAGIIETQFEVPVIKSTHDYH